MENSFPNGFKLKYYNSKTLPKIYSCKDWCKNHILLPSYLNIKKWRIATLKKIQLLFFGFYS